MTYKQFPLWPEWQDPVDRGEDQYELLCQLVRVATQITDFGIRVDRKRALAHVTAAEERRKLFTGLFLDATGLDKKQLGPTGSGQTDAVKKWFKDAGAPDVVFDKKTKEPQFSAPAFMCWAKDYPGSPFANAAAALLGLRTASTNRKFAKAYYAVSGRYDSRIHFRFNVIGTKGTRWSSSGSWVWRDWRGERCNNGKGYSLNCQNIPHKATSHDFGPGVGILALKTSLRDCFIPDKGTEWVKWDYEGAEAKLIAYNSGDAVLIDLIEKNQDIHTATARAMFAEFRIPAEVQKISSGMAIKPEWVAPLVPILRGIGLPENAEGVCLLWCKAREAAKSSIYALSYQAPNGQGKDEYPELFKTMKQQFPNLAMDYFKVLVGRFFGLYQGIKAWQLRICAQVEEGPITLPQTGKTLYLAPRARGKNQAMNFFQQSGLGSLINLATPIVAARCEWTRGGVALLAQVHDELDAQVPTRMVSEFEQFVATEMSRPANFGGTVAGISAEGDVGSNWEELSNIKKWKKEHESQLYTQVY